MADEVLRPRQLIEPPPLQRRANSTSAAVVRGVPQCGRPIASGLECFHQTECDAIAQRFGIGEPAPHVHRGSEISTPALTKRQAALPGGPAVQLAMLDPEG